MDLNLHDKVVLVTGGAKGIGEGIVRSFAAEGANVVILNRAGIEGENLVKELTESGATVSLVIADLCVYDDCKNAIEEVIASHGRIDILVNNAGVNDSLTLASGPEAFSKSLQLNLVHYYTMAHYCREQLIKNEGAIINIGSKVAETGQGDSSGYVAAKGGINALTREWAIAFLNDNVRVNTVIPAEVMTPLYENWLNRTENPDKEKARIESQIPLGNRFTSLSEIADMVVFLASSKSSHTTGQIIYVDGGCTHLDRACTSGE